MKKLRLLLALAASAVLILSGCAPQKESRAEFFAMNTFMSVSAFGKNADTAVSRTQSRVTELDRLWSVTDPDSELSRLNSGESFPVSPETAELTAFCAEMSEKTKGAFDPTIYPVLTAWGFTREENRVPPESEIAELLTRVGIENVLQKDNEIALKNGAMLDFGAAAKGYAGDEAARIMRENGVSSALINLGGSITTVGKNPNGSDWKIGVKNPAGDGNVGTLSLSNLSAVTSGAYERYFTAEDGTVYGHIIDPATGCPADNDLLSVTIVSENAARCDALSTALFVMGSEKAKRFYYKNHSALGFELIMITKNNSMIISRGLRGRFEWTDKQNYVLTVI